MEPVVEKIPQVKGMRNNLLEESLFSKDLSPHYMKLASQLASSELVPKSFRGKPQDLFICWAMGYQVGLSPERSMQCIAVINGKPTMWGDEMLALCMAHKDFDDIIEEPILKDGVVIGYSSIVKRNGKADKVNVFTLEMAKKAGLLAKGGVWIQYTERMLKLRARGFSLRDAFPDALKGIQSREEVEDYIDADYKVIEQKGSRTELLKKDYLNKIGASNAGLAEENTNNAPSEEALQTEEPESLVKDGEEATQLHLKIKQLLVEKEITEERITKALKFYESDSIDSLNEESARHFYIQIMKL